MFGASLDGLALCPRGGVFRCFCGDHFGRDDDLDLLDGGCHVSCGFHVVAHVYYLHDHRWR